MASYTFEMGSTGDGFYPPCSRYDALIQPNIPALLYAAKVARTPYITSHGPDARSVGADPGFVLGGQPVHLVASVNDADNGGDGIQAAEYYVDTPPWDGGSAVPMSPVDGAFGEVIEEVEASVPTGSWPPGRHILFVRGRDSLGNWGPVSAVFCETAIDSFVDGHVSDATTATAISGAELLLQGPADSYEATTDGAGYYVVPVLSGPYTVTASAFGYAPGVATGVEATTGVTTTQDFYLEPLPTGTLAGSVLELGTNVPLVADLVVETTPVTTTTEPSGAYSLVLPAGVYDVTASAPGHVPRTIAGVVIADGETTHLDLLLRTRPCLLLVDDDYSGSLPHGYETYYTSALRSVGIHYDTWSVLDDGFPPASALGAYAAVLWFTGDVRYGTLNVTEQTALRQYLNAGGALFLSGQNVAYDIVADPGDFLGQVLRASFVADDADLTTLDGGDILRGQSISISGGDGAGNQDSPDVIAP
ncbi:MAG TPA: carboxypeptidase regulatory-like domain-containing protein, partial [Mycobacterium sp.]|nr:carboxypeptidase regulatory-like domain-containing protein [Mycobacterium sp.]